MYPDEVAALVGREFLFKVEKAADHGARYDLSFKVKKLCDDAAIISSFKADDDIQTPTKVIMLLDLFIHPHVYFMVICTDIVVVLSS